MPGKYFSTSFCENSLPKSAKIQANYPTPIRIWQNLSQEISIKKEIINQTIPLHRMK
jgi:hypothetical protein